MSSVRSRISFSTSSVILAVGQKSVKKYPDTLTVGDKVYTTDEWTNIPPFILELTKRQLHQNENHPIGILKDLIEKNFSSMGYTFYNDFKPNVTTYENFDILGFPKDHPGRSKSDTYYLNKDNLLRTHTSAHEHECFQKTTLPGYFITADVYRKDEIDRTHYPAFHQMEGARLWTLGEGVEEDIMASTAAIPSTNIIVEDPHREKPISPANPKQDYMTERQAQLIAVDLKKTIEYLVHTVFESARECAKLSGATDPYLDEPLKVRWNEDCFPWTTPSWEIEVWWKGEWLECCGCGIVKQPILLNAGLSDKKLGWAFGVGLDRIAMLLFGIPDIRLFWTQDERFSKQFTKGTISTFKPYSKYPGIKRDVAFWIPKEIEAVHVNEVMEIVRTYGGDLIENVTCIDEFVHPKTGRKSQCYRINYQSMDRNLTNEEINEIQQKVEGDLVNYFGVELR